LNNQSPLQPTNLNTIEFSSKEEQQLFETIIDAIQDKKGEAIVSLDLRDIQEAVADYFIICEVNSGVQMAAIADHIERKVREKLSERPYQFEVSPTWSLVDYISIVIHIFQKDERKFYDLESLWMDATLVEHS